MRALPLALFVAVCAACAGEEPRAASQRPVPAGPGDGVLFVGNSLTFANDLPGMVERLAAAGGVRLPTAQVTFGGYSLSDHLANGDAARSIAGGGWRVVVLQQGPSGQPESRIDLRKDTARFDGLIRRAGARTAIFAVWADSHGPSTFEDVRESYFLAAQDVSAIYFPVNEAWTLAWSRDPALPLYSSDGFHPSAEGTYLAALVIAHLLTGIAPSLMPPPTGVPATDAKTLQDAAADATVAPERQ
jgi:hypothetical protein